MTRVLIVNGYSDEPTCFNVPPYIGKYPRYIAGAVLSAEKGATVVYRTIDDFRQKRVTVSDIDGKFEIVVFIVGMTVPGKYVGGEIATGEEISSISSGLRKVKTRVLAGPAARFGFGNEGGKATKIIKEPFDLICRGDDEAVIYSLVKTGKATGIEKTKREDPLLTEFAIRGAEILEQIDTRYLLCEIETYRGCPRFVSGFCSFCSEMWRGPPDFRTVESVIDEVRALSARGVHAFRLGDQPDLFAFWGAGAGKLDYPKPNPDVIEKLFRGVREAAPNLTVLHIDNVNPGTVVNHPEEARKVAGIIAKYNTPGDIAAFGLESVDPVVVKENNLKITTEDAIKAVEIINSAGGFREGRSLPKLLPGINFVCGLKGETKETFKLNYAFLEELLKRKLLVRRINIRQVMPLPGTRMQSTGSKLVEKHEREFASFKFKVRENIDHKMLSGVAPVGTVLPRAMAEYQEKGVTFCRQLGSYPLLIGVPKVLPLGQFYTLKAVDWGKRSITALPSDIDINKEERKVLEYLPGIGSRNIVKLLAKRPIRKLSDFISEKDSLSKLSEFLEIPGDKELTY